MPVNHIAEHYLSSFFAGQPLPAEVAFLDRLNALRLDYSQQSLGRIDQMLDQIRLEKQPPFGSFYDDHANQTFMYLLCFYVGTVVAKAANQPINWYPHEELVKLTGDSASFPLRFATSMTCLLGDRVHFVPLASIEERLFVDTPETSVQSAAARFIQLCGTPQDMPTLRRPESLVSNGRSPSATFDGTAELLGSLIAYSTYLVAGGSTLMPVITNGNKTIRQLAYNSLDAAINAGQQELQTNPNNDRQLAFVYDGYITIGSARTDALIAEARQYTPKSLFMKPSQDFRIAVVLPYRPGKDAEGFRVFTPKLLGLDANPSLQPFIVQAFYRGVDSFKQPSEVWPKETPEFV